jgi:phage tail P2-like protein
MSDYSLLPDNKSALERGLELAFTELLGEIETPYPNLLNPRKTPTRILPYIAQDRGVIEWNAKAPRSEQEQVVATAYQQYKQAGTPAGLKVALSPLSGDVDVEPWHKYGGEPYHLRVVAWLPAAPTDELLSLVADRLENAQSGRDVISLSLGVKASGQFYFGAAVHIAPRIVVGPWRPPSIVTTKTMTVGGAFVASYKVTVR